MNRIKNFLLENETYEDGLKRALRCWAAQEEKLQAENTTLRAFKEDIEYVAEREANDAKELAAAVKERIDAYGGE